MCEYTQFMKLGAYFVYVYVVLVIEFIEFCLLNDVVKL